MYEFDIKAQEKLGFYVYGLFDSGNPNLPFYLGKGCGNRVFSHARGEQFFKAEDELLSRKYQNISDIRNAGRLVIHKIIRFGLSEDEAFKIEASLIDLVNLINPDTLKNEISGQGVSEGIYDACDLAIALCAKEMAINEPLILIKIERLWSELITKYGSSTNIPLQEIYNATKGNWRLDLNRVRKASCVISVARGIVRGIFIPIEWSESGFGNRKKMLCDVNELGKSNFQNHVGTSVAHLFSKGSQNPIRYLQC